MSQLADNHEKHLKITLGQRLRRLRQSKYLSLEELAKITNVSKLTLGNIERGDANPSLSVIWKISSALSVPLSSLLTHEDEIILAKITDKQPLMSVDDVLVTEQMFSIDGSEMFRYYFKPHSVYKPVIQANTSVHIITVMKGELTVQINKEEHLLKQFEAIRFHSNFDYSFKNKTSNEVVFQVIVQDMN
ncbi:helix-turn-helix domain-containing protein [Alkalihalobacterium bogoriense]|uniref:helix-turn-helix domain-containing protein n=1 Tax=Alkalihalobacterium bogoriense TaxID=246272 RepID=UPI000685618F|nr:XRE family transcriptional regulator [Alkalihalobacterium bogoriense]